MASVAVGPGVAAVVLRPAVASVLGGFPSCSWTSFCRWLCSVYSSVFQGAPPPCHHANHAAYAFSALTKRAFSDASSVVRLSMANLRLADRKACAETSGATKIPMAIAGSAPWPRPRAPTPLSPLEPS